MREPTAPRVLVVCGYCPFPPSWGAAMRVLQLVRQLSREFSVTVVAYASGEFELAQRGLLEICDDVCLVPWRPRAGWSRRALQARSLIGRETFTRKSLYSPEMQQVIDRYLGRRQFDSVQIESSSMLSFRYDTDVPLVVDEHNIESELLRRHAEGEAGRIRRTFNAIEAHKYARLEASAWNRASACVVTSEREAPVVSARAPHAAVSVIPNGVDTDFFMPTGLPVDPDSIVFTGRLDYRPNLDGVRYFIAEVLPRIRRVRPRARLTVLGGGPAAELGSLPGGAVRVAGLVPDVRPYLESAGCIVVPIRMGGGTRLKVLEGLAMARPVVSTGLGCEGIAVQADRELLIADEPERFAQAVLDVLNNPQHAARLGAAGRELVRTRYSWEGWGQSLRDVHHRLHGRSGETRGLEVRTGTGSE